MPSSQKVGQQGEVDMTTVVSTQAKQPRHRFSVGLKGCRQQHLLHDRKTEHFKALSKCDHTSAIGDHVKTTRHNIKWDHFDILASGKTDFHCKIKETLLIQELQPSLNVNVSSEKLLLV